MQRPKSGKSARSSAPSEQVFNSREAVKLGARGPVRVSGEAHLSESELKQVREIDQIVGTDNPVRELLKHPTAMSAQPSSPLRQA